MLYFINKNQVFAFFIFISFSAFTMEAENSFINISSSEQKLEFAFRTYFNKEKDQEIIVCPNTHLAIKGFYQHINKLIQNKIVIYEYPHCTFEQRKSVLNKIDELNEPEKGLAEILIKSDFYFLSQCYPDFLESEDTGLSYDNASQLIHADWTLDSVKIDDFYAKCFSAKTTDELKQVILDEVEYNRGGEENIQKDILIMKKLFAKAPWSMVKEGLLVDKQFFRTNILPRNQIMYQKITELVTSSDGTRMVVVYGANHLQEMDLFLKNLGFNLQDEQWITSIKFPEYECTLFYDLYSQLEKMVISLRSWSLWLWS